jgi:hypothetical protein
MEGVERKDKGSLVLACLVCLLASSLVLRSIWLQARILGLGGGVDTCSKLAVVLTKCLQNAHELGHGHSVAFSGLAPLMLLLLKFVADGLSVDVEQETRIDSQHSREHPFALFVC